MFVSSAWMHHLQHSGEVMSGTSCKANGAVYPASTTVMTTVKKPKMEQIQADHELFLQAFESEFHDFLLITGSNDFKPGGNL